MKKRIMITVWEEEESDVLGSIEDRLWDVLSNMGASPILDEQGRSHGLVSIAGILCAVEDVNLEEPEEPEPEVLLQLGFRFYGAPMAEILEVSNQRRFEKWALDWQEGTLEEYLISEDDIRAVYEEQPADPETGQEREVEFVCFQIGNVKIDIC